MKAYLLLYIPLSDSNFLICSHSSLFGSRDSVVGIANRLRAGLPKGQSSSRGRVQEFSVSSRLPLGSTQWVPGALSPGVERPGREADHSLPTSAEVKKMWIYTSTPIRLHGVVLN
jgi:hypothetical protein